MSDLEKLKKLLDDFGVEYEIKINEDGTRWVRCRAGSKKVGGYNWFYTKFNFDLDDKFIDMGAWE